MKIAELLEIRAEDLDNAVHDCSGEQASARMNQAVDFDDELDEILEEWEAIARTVNNGGLGAQIRFLMLFGCISELVQDYADVLAALEVRGRCASSLRRRETDRF